MLLVSFMAKRLKAYLAKGKENFFRRRSGEVYDAWRRKMYKATQDMCSKFHAVNDRIPSTANCTTENQKKAKKQLQLQDLFLATRFQGTIGVVYFINYMPKPAFNCQTNSINLQLQT